MARNKIEFDDLLTMADRDQLRDAVNRWPTPLNLPQVQRLGAHAAALVPALQPLHVAIVHTYTSDLLDPWLNLSGALSGLEVRTYHAPYGLALQEAEPGSPLLAHEPDITILMLRREDLHPSLSMPITGMSADARQALSTESLAHVKDIVSRFRAQRVGHLVLTLLPSLTPPSLGLFDQQAESSEALWWSAFRHELSSWIRTSSPATLLMDLEEVALQVGRAQFFDRRYWHSAQFPFSAAAALEFTRRLMAVATVLKTPRAKVIVLDADNTLWGGVVGEDGVNGIALGPEYPGSAYREFQRRILDFQQRGFILAMCSKNNPADVDEVLQTHPHQILREAHFAARRVNWTPKPDNLLSLAEELNLGLDSFIFVDDSDHECAAVRARLPQVQVVQVPSRAVDVASCLDQVARLEVLSLTKEDLEKTAMYAQERQRREILDQASATGDDAGDYLTRLGMKMRVTLAPSAHLTRLSQLTKKTNQFNLTTRRYDEHQMQVFITSPDWLVADFSLADVFGDSGIVGLAMFRIVGSTSAELDTLLMSCRVIGRQAESAFLNALFGQLAHRGVDRILADYIPTPKNPLVKDLLPQHGFVRRSDGRYERSLNDQPPLPAGHFPIDVSVTDLGGPEDRPT
jgi:FkbH-like protein